MKKDKYGIITSRPKGGIIRCGDCGRILAYIWDKNLSYAYLQFRCHCGGCGVLSTGKCDSFSAVAMAEDKDDTLSCPECGRVWLQKESGMVTFSFRFLCQCGVSTETAHKPKREIYQELKFT
ncbi:MAG: hypothetical protein IKW60_02310 [Clostridia bacterium]|nr:hypothetical protein [Clostridia bacterium]